MNKTKIKADNNKIELAKWLLIQQEQLRTNNLNRSYVILTAGLLAIASYTLILGRVTDLPQYLILHIPAAIVFDLPFLVGYFLCYLTVYYAIRGVVHIGKRSRDILDDTVPPRLFIHPKETIKHFNNYSEFKKAFQVMDDSEMQEYLLSNLWSVYIAHDISYGYLRMAARMLIAASVLLFYQIIAMAISCGIQNIYVK